MQIPYLLQENQDLLQAFSTWTTLKVQLVDAPEEIEIGAGRAGLGNIKILVACKVQIFSPGSPIHIKLDRIMEKTLIIVMQSIVGLS